jgi:hypothetical protein
MKALVVDKVAKARIRALDLTMTNLSYASICLSKVQRVNEKTRADEHSVLKEERKKERKKEKKAMTGFERV